MIKTLIRKVAVKAVRVACNSPSVKNIISEFVLSKEKSNEFQFVEIDKNLATELDAIPSQTTRGERRLLYHFFRSQWTGRGDVVEIGPFLGGTSRAIAMGMLENPRRESNSKLFTYDRFQDYFDLNSLKKYLAPLIDNMQLDQNDLEKLGERARFIDIFKSVHENNTYYSCLQPSDHGVPDLPEEKDQGPWMVLPEGFKTDAIFIDGCKSWYGTKYFMQLMGPAARPGSIFIFQDFGWFTCFWLATFIEIFSDFFTLIGQVDNTYLFRLNTNISSQEIENNFPDSPISVGGMSLCKLLDSQIEKAINRGDHYAALRHTLHKAGALAYVNDLNGARSSIRQAEAMPTANSHKSVIEMAWKSPTYTPSNPIHLGKIS